MLITFLINLIIAAIIIGYSFIFKLIISENKNVKIYNLDFIYGIFFKLQRVNSNIFSNNESDQSKTFIVKGD